MLHAVSASVDHDQIFGQPDNEPKLGLETTVGQAIRSLGSLFDATQSQLLQAGFCIAVLLRSLMVHCIVSYCIVSWCYRIVLWCYCVASWPRMIA